MGDELTRPVGRLGQHLWFWVGPATGGFSKRKWFTGFTSRDSSALGSADCGGGAPHRCVGGGPVGSRSTYLYLVEETRFPADLLLVVHGSAGQPETYTDTEQGQENGIFERAPRHEELLVGQRVRQFRSSDWTGHEKEPNRSQIQLVGLPVRSSLDDFFNVFRFFLWQCLVQKLIQELPTSTTSVIQPFAFIEFDTSKVN